MPKVSGRSERLAVSLADLDRVDPAIRQKLLKDKLDLSAILKLGTDRKEATACVAFSCDLLQAAIICDILRSHDRGAGDYPTTLYLFKVTGWTRIPNNVVLTVHDGNKASLSPKVFAGVVELAPPVAAKAIPLW